MLEVALRLTRMVYLLLGSRIRRRASDLFTVSTNSITSIAAAVPRARSHSRCQLDSVCAVRGKRRAEEQRALGVSPSGPPQRLLSAMRRQPNHYETRYVPSLIVREFTYNAWAAAFDHLMKLAREGLRLELRTALYQAVRDRTNVEARGLKLAT